MVGGLVIVALNDVVVASLQEIELLDNLSNGLCGLKTRGARNKCETPLLLAFPKFRRALKVTFIWISSAQSVPLCTKFN